MRGFHVEVVAYDIDARSRREELVDDLSHHVCPIHAGMTVANVHVRPADQGRADHEQVSHAIALVLVFVFSGIAWTCRQWQAPLFNVLLTGCIHAHERPD